MGLWTLLKRNGGWGTQSMKIRPFLRDKCYLIFSWFGVSFILTLFLSLLKIQTEVIIVVNVFVTGIVILVIGVEFNRRKKYYDELYASFNILEKKYLMFEMLPDACFFDAYNFEHIIHVTGKSMSDHVGAYRRLQDDYKEYIELWIHEVKTPLAAAKLIVANHPNEEASILLQELDRVENYLEQVLFYARSASAEKDYLIQRIKLNDVVRNVVRELSPIFIERHVGLTFECDEIYVYSDPKWLEFMIKQVVGNALKYVASDTGMVVITCHAEAQRIILQIHDNGPGMIESDRMRAFERGFTGQMGRKSKQATGMGLYLVKTLGDKLHIDISITNQSGLCVTFVFPKSDMMFND